MDRIAGDRPLSGSGGGADRGGLRGERDPLHPHGLRQEPGRRGGALHGAGPGQGHLLHRPDQGPGLGEVLRPVQALRHGERRHADRRRLGQRRRPGHRLYRRGARLDRAARRQVRRHRPGRDGRVPLLRGTGPRLGLADPDPGASAGPVHPDVGDPRRRQDVRGGPDPPHRPSDLRGALGDAPGAAELRVPADADHGDAHRTAGHPAVARLHRALHAGRRGGAGAVADEHQHVHEGGEGEDRRPDRQLPLHHQVRAEPLPLRAPRDRGAPRGDAPQVPEARGEARPGGPAEGHLRDGHAGRRRQRAHPHGAVHRPDEVRRHPGAHPAGP